MVEGTQKPTMKTRSSTLHQPFICSYYWLFTTITVAETSLSPSLRGCDFGPQIVSPSQVAQNTLRISAAHQQELPREFNFFLEPSWAETLVQLEITSFPFYLACLHFLHYPFNIASYTYMFPRRTPAKDRRLVLQPEVQGVSTSTIRKRQATERTLETADRETGRPR